MKNSRGFIQIIVIILVVLATLAGAYYFGTKNKTIPSPVASAQPSSSPITQTTPDPATANWKTYNNLKIPLQFQYPTNYTLDDSNPSESRTGYYNIRISSPTTVNKAMTYTNKELGIEIIVTPIDAQKFSASDAGLIVVSKKIIKIGGIDATQEDYQGGEGNSSTSYYFVFNNLQFRIDKFPPTTTRDAEFDQILSTFKFTN